MGLWITLRMCTRRNFLLFVCSLQLVNIFFFYFSCHSLEFLTRKNFAAAAVVDRRNIFISNILSIESRDSCRVIVLMKYQNRTRSSLIWSDDLCVPRQTFSFRSVNFALEIFLLSIIINWAFDCESWWNNESYRKNLSYIIFKSDAMRA